MKKRKAAIIFLTFALCATSAGALAACRDNPGESETPPEYTFEDGRPDGEVAEPDEGFKIDGVLDEAAYSSIKWLEGPVLRPYYTSDGQGIYYDYDLIQEKSQSAAQVKMGTYYGENGLYLAYSYKEQEGKVCYVNPTRSAYRNSGVELHIGIPASVSMTGDETISRLTVNANGALTIAKTQGDTWMAPFGTIDEKNMPYVGLTGNGTRTDENADRTEYTFELFIPWGYFDEVGGEGTSDGMKAGGDLVVAPGIITANNYTGTGQTDREYYVLSSRLDDGTWSDAQGWYHFNKEGVVAYDIDIVQPQNGVVQEWMGYDTAPTNSSVTFVIKADEGYALKEFRVNGVAVPSDQIHFDMYTSTGVEAEEDMQKAYVRIPQRDVTGDLRVEAVFEPLSSGVQTLTATVYGASTDNPLANTVVTFKRGDTVISGTTDANGSITLEGLTAGLYEVSVSDTDYKGFLDYVFISPEANAQIVFEVNSIALEGIGRAASNYTEIYGKVGSLEGGFVFSGFFGYEGADYDDLVNFTNTVYFVNDVVSTTQTGFRFTKWGNYLMVKYENAEYHFEADAEAVAYFKENSGVYFTFAVDGEGNVSAYIRRSDTEWMLLETNTSVSFPVDLPVESIRFAKQDDSNGSHVAVLKDGSLKVGTGRVDIPVSFTLNGEAPQEGGMQLTGGKVDVPANTVLGDNVTITMTPESDYIISLKVDGQTVTCQQGANGTYTYSFRATSQNYAFEAAFVRVSAQLTLNAAIDPALGSIADDLTVNVSSGSVSLEPTREGTVYTTPSLPYGAYTIKVTSKEGGYTVLERNIVFEEGRESFTLDITADNYGANRKYELWGENNSENGVSIAETIGMPDGYVFEGFLGVGGIGRLSEIGSLNYATALRFTTESGYQYRVCLYIWNGQYWLIKVFEEGKENSAQSHEFAFTENVGLIDYIKEKNGITVNIGVDTQGNFSVYAMTNETDWISLGSWQMTEYEHGKIEKVELLRMFNNGLTGWTAIVEGEIGFGSADVKIPVTVHGMEDVTGGTVEATSANIGEEVTLTLTPDDTHVYGSLMVDGVEVVGEEGENGVYTYTFATTKSSYQIQAIFADGGNVNISASIDGSLGAVAGDLEMVLTNDFVTKTAAYGGSVWTFSRVAYGTYTLTVYSKSGDYIVLTQEVSFSAGAPSASISITPDNYGDNRKYALNGAWDNEGGTVLWEKLGAPVNGFVFEGFLGVGGSGNLNNIGSLNYATALRFTTDSGYQYRICFYIWEGRYWLVKVFEEGLENQPQSHEFGFSDNTALIDYVKAKNGITVNIGVDTQGNFTVYAMTSETDWISLGSWRMTEYENGKIEKVELLRMFQNGLDGWMATVDGTLSFGSAEINIPVTVNGTENVTGGKVEATSAKIGEEVTLTLTPDENYAFISLTVDGEAVSCTENGGVYTYTFTAIKSSYTLAAEFEKTGGTYTVNVSIDGSFTDAANDLQVVLVGTSTEYATTKGEDNTWTTTQSLPYGEYTIRVTSVSGDYIVLEQQVTFEEGSESATVNVTAENYGDNRKYALNGAWDDEGGAVILENLGAPVNGYVFEGFLGVGGSGDLKNIGSLNYATALRFTTDSDYQYRVCFYIWNGRYWIIKVFEEGQENSAQSHEFGFSDNTALIDYVKAKNGITVNIGVDTQGNFTVYAMTSETDWISLGSWRMTEYENGKIEKVELLRMFQNGLDGWMATVDGTLSFGSAEINIPVTVNGTENVTGGKVEATSANIGEQVTITLTPDESHVFGSLKVDGQAVTCQADENGVYIYTFTATKSSHQIEAVFAEGGDLTITVTGVSVDSSDLTIEVSNGSVTKEATLEGGSWTVSRIAYGTYTITVSSKSGGYTVLTQEVNFEAGSLSAEVEITAENYGDNRKYELQGQNDEEYSGGVLAEDLGSTESFVFKGFLGIKEGGESLDALKNSGNGSFGAGLRFIMSDGNSFRIAFVANNGTWSIRCYWQDSGNSEHDNVALTMDDTLKNYVSANGGVNIIAVAEKVGGTPTVTIFVECAENTWQQLGTYANGNVPLDKAIEQVTIAKMWINNNPNRTSYAEGTLSFGTTDTGIAVSFSGTGSVTGGTVSTSDSVELGEEVTVTLTPEEGYVFTSLNVDGARVECTAGEDGVYTYTFTANKNSYTLAAVFELAGGTYTVNVSIDGSLTGAAEDLKVVLVGASTEYVAAEGEGNTWTTESIPYGTYTLVVTSVSGGYTVFEQQVTFEETSTSTTVNVTAENWGANREYVLNTNDVAEEYPGETLAENLGAPTGGFVFEGFLGINAENATTGNEEGLANLGSDSFGTSIRFTTSNNDYKWRIALVRTSNQWEIRCYQESGEDPKYQYYFTDLDDVVSYVTQENGAHIMVSLSSDKQLTVYIQKSATEWVSLGTQSVIFDVGESIEKVEAAIMWVSVFTGKGWTGVVDGELRFGTTDTGVEVSFTGTGDVTNGNVSVSEAPELGKEVTVTLTPSDGYMFRSLKVDGTIVACTADESGVYIYTFTATKNSYQIEAAFAEGGDLTITVVDSASASDDLKIEVTNGSVTKEATLDDGTWTVSDLPYGDYTVIVYSLSGGYTVLMQEVNFEAGSLSAEVTITTDNYGDNRKYALNGAWDNESGTVILENLGAPVNGYVFEGFLGVGGSGSLNNIGSLNYATALRFTTEEGYQYRVCFYIWNGQYWLIKVFEEGKENSAQSHEFAFTGNTALINYVKEKNGITVNISVDTEGNFSVYAMTSDNVWTSLGSWQMTEYKSGKIEKVELLRMFQNGLDGWTATVDGTLSFGTTDTGISDGSENAGK